MATNRSSCARALSSLVPSGPDTTGLPQLISIALIWPRPSVVISSGNSLSAWAPATISRPASLLVCGFGFTMAERRIASTYPGSNLRPAGAVHPAGDHVEHVTEPLRDGARKVQGNPGPGHHHRAARSGEIPGHPLDLGAG